MNQTEEEGEESGQGEKEERVLLNPEDWEDPSRRKVLSEFHKEGLPEDLDRVEADLDSFEQYWSERGGLNSSGEYHKEGSPYLDEYPNRAYEVGETSSAKEAEKGTLPGSEGEEAPGTDRSEGKEEAGRGSSSIPHPIDIGLLEVISYGLFRALIGTGLKVPVKREGLVDMDIIVKDKDIVLNTNELFFAMPDLAIWRVIYSHKGKSVFEFGRGVKKGVKIHPLNTLILGIELWRMSRKSRKLKFIPPMGVSSDKK